MRIASQVLALAVVLILSPNAAGAQEATGDIPDQELLSKDFLAKADELVKTIAKRALTRARRAFALGPYVGIAPGLALADEISGEFSLSFGLGLYKYDIPITPSVSQLKDAIKERFLALVKEKIKALASKGQKPTKADIERFVRESWQEVKDELTLAYRPNRFEKPGFSIALEGLYLFAAGEWDVRAQVGLGVSVVQLSAGLSLHVGDGVNLVIPVEISKPMMLSRSVRAPTVHFFVRGDVAVTGRDEVPDRFFLGARFALDLI